MLTQLLNKFPTAIKHSMVYGLSIALMKSVSLLMLPITAHYLQPTQFGQLELLTSIGIVCSILVGLGLENTLFRFAGTHSDQHKNRQGASAILALALIAGMISLCVAWLAAPDIAVRLSVDISAYQLRLVFIMISLEGAIAIPLAWFRMQQRVVLFFLATCLRTIAQASLIVAFLYTGFGVEGVLGACLIAAAVQAIILTTIMVREVGIVINLSQFKQLLSYSLPIVGSGLIAFSLAGFDRWLLAAERPLSDVAIYGIAAKFAIATVLLVQPFGMWWLPKRFVVLKQQSGEIKAAHYITIGILVVMSVAIMVAILAPFLIHWLLAPVYHQTINYVLWLVLAMAFKEIAELVNIGCFCGDTTYQQLVINLICATLGLTVMWLGISVWGIWAVVAALNIAYATKAVIFFMVSQRNVPLPYDRIKLMLIIATGIAVVLLSQYIPLNLHGLLASLAIFMTLFLATIKRRGFSLHENLG